MKPTYLKIPTIKESNYNKPIKTIIISSSNVDDLIYMINSLKEKHKHLSFDFYIIQNTPHRIDYKLRKSGLEYKYIKKNKSSLYEAINSLINDFKEDDFVFVLSDQLIFMNNAVDSMINNFGQNILTIGVQTLLSNQMIKQQGISFITNRLYEEYAVRNIASRTQLFSYDRKEVFANKIECCLINLKAFKNVNGFNNKLLFLHDIELCVKGINKGYKNLVCNNGIVYDLSTYDNICKDDVLYSMKQISNMIKLNKEKYIKYMEIFNG